MLSLDKGTPLFFQVSKDDGKKIDTIRFDQNAKKDSDLIVDNPLNLISKKNWKDVKKKHQLSTFNIEQLKRYIKQGSFNPDSNVKFHSGVIEQAHNTVSKMFQKTLKNSLIFDDKTYKNTELIPSAKKFTVMTIVGPSGSGKSVFSSKVIRLSKKKDEKVYLLTRRLNTTDPAFEGLEDDIIEVDVENFDSIPDLEDLENSFVLIDDIEGLKKDIREFILDWVSSIVTTGRKLNIRIIFSSHLVQGFAMRHINNESRVRIFFPHSNKWKIRQELRLKYGLPTYKIDEMFEAVKIDNSRTLILQTASPFLYATEKRVILL